MLQPTVQDVTNAEKLLNSIEKFSDSIADVFSDELISSKKFEMKRDNFSKIRNEEQIHIYIYIAFTLRIIVLNYVYTYIQTAINT